jgi:DNA helicase-2/ATP-dependent DNA helicase PcrA
VSPCIVAAMSSIDAKLTDEQRAIIAHQEGPALALAVAGSGKTTTVLLRVHRMVRDGVSPDEILLTTFSRLGTSDMRRRATELGIPSAVRFRTLHSVAWERIGAERRNWKLPPEWWVRETVNDAAEQWLKKNGRGGIKPQDTSDIDVLVPTREIMSAIGRAKANLILPDEWTAKTTGERFPGFVEWVKQNDGTSEMFVELACHCYRVLEEARRSPLAHERGRNVFQPRQVACTHDDALLEYARAAYDDEPWIKNARGRYGYVILDEAQDTNLAQWAIVQWVAREHQTRALDYQNLMAVGDSEQAIYLFRGANPKLMVDFVNRNGPILRTYPLSMNFRSGKAILDVANKLLLKATSRLYRGELRCGRPEIEAEVQLNRFVTETDEAPWVANEIERSIKEDGVEPSEIAVLYRVNATAGSIEMEMIKRKIPYRIAGRGFFSLPIVDAAVRYIALALDDTDRDAYQLCYRVPLRWVKKALLKEYASLRSLRECPRGQLSAKSGGLYRLMKEMDRLCAQLDEFGLVRGLEFVFNEIGLVEHFSNQRSGDDESGALKMAIDELLACAEATGDAKSFVRFATEMKNKETRDAIKAEKDDMDDGERVTLSTAHSAKGLEWTDVYVIGMKQGLFPLMSAPTDEERRLAYVAFTRAKKRLMISFGGNKDGEVPTPSVFLVDAGLCSMPQLDSGLVDDPSLVGEL